MSDPSRHKGKKKGNITLYALSTCIWCKKTRRLLDELGADYKVIEVDLIESSEEKESVREQVRKWNREITYPTMVINGEECILGFDEDKIREKVKT